MGYPGIWLEHNHDSLFYLRHDPEVSKASHEIFFHFQAEDGLFPAYICKPHGEVTYRIGYGHVQTVYPIAASSWEIAKSTKDEAFLEKAYEACVKYDEWFMKYRNTRGTGLVEMFCEWDTGHDNSARVTDGGIPSCCPDGDSRICPSVDVLPIISTDLTATVYGGRIALAAMAEALNKDNEAALWKEKAEEMKAKLIELCFDEEDEFFYDVDSKGNLRKYKTEHIFRLFINRVLDQDMFDRIYKRYIKSPDHFWTPYPFPSVSISDPSYNSQLKYNSWGGMSQSHTALETLFWMEHYGVSEDMEKVMQIWVKQFTNSHKDFAQEMDPLTGEFSDCAPYFTPSLIAYIEFVDRLYGSEKNKI